MHPEEVYYDETGKAWFSYSREKWNEWYNLGITEGTVGSLLMSIDKEFLEYYCFGTLEHPVTSMYKMTFVHNPGFDGPLLAPEEYLERNYKPRAWIGNPQFIVLNTGGDNEKV